MSGQGEERRAGHVYACVVERKEMKRNREKRRESRVVVMDEDMMRKERHLRVGSYM